MVHSVLVIIQEDRITEKVVEYCIWNLKESGKVMCNVANIRRRILRG